MSHEIKKDAEPNFVDLMEYVVSYLQRLVLMRSGSKVKLFCEMNDICLLRIANPENRFRLEVCFWSHVGKISPLGEKERLWLERHLCAELELEEVDQHSEGGGNVYYTIKRPHERYDMICPKRHMEDVWWDGGAWYAHE